MQKMHFRNNAETELSMIVEPIADRYVIEPGSSIFIEYEIDSDEAVEVEYHSSSEVAVWTHGPTKAYANGKLLVAE